jgi:hypothetical protein
LVSSDDGEKVFASFSPSSEEDMLLLKMDIGGAPGTQEPDDQTDCHTKKHYFSSEKSQSKGSCTTDTTQNNACDQENTASSDEFRPPKTTRMDDKE